MYTADAARALPTSSDTQEAPVKAPNIESPHWINVRDSSFGDMTGKVIAVNFWTFACHHCQSLLRHLAVLNKNFRGANFQLVGVHTPEFLFEADIANVKRAVRDYRISWPVAIDNDSQNYNAFEVRFWPTTILINQEGYISGRYIGAGSFPDLARDVQRLVLQ